MTIHLNIGEEGSQLNKPRTRTSRHQLNLKEETKDVSVSRNLKNPKNSKKAQASDLKDEIRVKNKRSTGKISIVGQLPRSKQGLGRAPVVIAAVLMIFALNLGQLFFVGTSRGEEAMALAGEAVDTLRGAGQQLLAGELSEETQEFTVAQEKFQEAKERVDFLLSHESNWLSEPKQVATLRNLIESGELLTEAAEHIAIAKLRFLNRDPGASLTELIKELSSEQVEPALAKLNTVSELLSDVDLSGTEYAEVFVQYRASLQAANEVLSLWSEAKDPMLLALGDRYPQHYLLLLMNNDEPRPGGGFIGNVGLLEMDDGKITELSIQDVYELDNRYYDEIPVPLHELRGLTPNWRLRDSNAFVDFPSTAEQAMWFYEEEAGQTVDGVIAINLSTAQALLELTGPVTLPSAGQELSAADFPAVMSTLVEAKVAGPQPKSILNEFIDSFMQTLKTRTELYPQLGSLLLEQMEKKQLLVYHRSGEIQDFMSSLGLSASIPKLSTVEGDFALPVFTSMGANKTERYMSTQLYHDTQILGDRAIVNQFTIERTHQFNAVTLAWLKNRSAAFGFTAWNRDLENLLGAGVNRTGVRIYLPEGAQILNVSGDVHRNDLQFKYDAENDISYYFLDQSIEAGESQTLSIQYALPWLHDEDFGGYQFQLFKQPGFKNVSFQKTVTASGRDLLSSTEPASFTDPNVDYVLEGPLHSDVDVELLFR